MSMKVVRDLSKMRCRRESVVTVGSFDGIHLGHHKILREVVLLARGLSATGIVVTFDPHPMAVVHPREAPCLLTTSKEKMRLIGEIGVGKTVVVKFTAKLAGRSAEWFVRDLLIKRLNMRRLVIGYDFRFGFGREGDAPYLERLGQRLGFGVDIVPPVNYLNHPVSSTRVRTALVRGDVAAAACMLGRPYALSGTVVRGEGIGRVLDFPTANIEVDEPAKILPANGVYAVRVEIGGKQASGALYVGTRPTFGGGARNVEVHIMGLKRSLYGRRVGVGFVKRIRDDAVFTGQEALRDAIRADVSKAARLLST
jgi:riboflavin kinase/FMN adenylyltransferase